MSGIMNMAEIVKVTNIFLTLLVTGNILLLQELTICDGKSLLETENKIQLENNNVAATQGKMCGDSNKDFL